MLSCLKSKASLIFHVELSSIPTTPANADIHSVCLYSREYCFKNEIQVQHAEHLSILKVNLYILVCKITGSSVIQAFYYSCIEEKETYVQGDTTIPCLGYAHIPPCSWWLF